MKYCSGLVWSRGWVLPGTGHRAWNVVEVIFDNPVPGRAGRDTDHVELILGNLDDLFHQGNLIVIAAGCFDLIVQFHLLLDNLGRLFRRRIGSGTAGIVVPGYPRLSKGRLLAEGEEVAGIQENRRTCAGAPNVNIVLISIFAGIKQRSVDHVQFGIDPTILPLLNHNFGSIIETKRVGGLYGKGERARHPAPRKSHRSLVR